jgi:O-antigen ligase
MNKQVLTYFLDKILLLIVIFSPIIIILRSLVMNITLAVASIIVLFYILKKKKIEIFKNKLVFYIIIFFSFIFINSVIHSSSFELLFKSFANFRYLFFSIAVFFVLEKISNKNFLFFIYFNVTIIFLVALDILYQLIFFENILKYPPGMCEDLLAYRCLRFSGVFGDELIAGAYLSQIGILILILLFNLLSKKILSNFLIKLFTFLFFFIIVLITGERTALIIIIFFLFFLFFFKRKIIKFIIISIFLLILIFISSLKIENINTRFIKLFDSWPLTSKNLSITNKINENPWIHHYQAAIEIFLEKPILGNGPKSFRTKCINTDFNKKIKEFWANDKRIDISACSTHPHNYLIEFLIDHGAVGGIFYIGLIFFIFINIYNKSKNNKNNNLLVMICIGSLILAIIFPFKPSGSFFSTFNSYMFFYILGFFLHYLKKIK